MNERKNEGRMTLGRISYYEKTVALVFHQLLQNDLNISLVAEYPICNDKFSSVKYFTKLRGLGWRMVFYICWSVD